MNFTRKWVAGLAFIAASSLFAIETATVGYTSVDVKPGGFQMVCAPFVTVNENTAYDLQDLIVSGAVAGKRMSSADVIQTWDATATSYSVYFYKSFSDDSCAWVSQDATDIPVANINVVAGQAFWYKRNNSATTTPIVMAGAINPQERNTEVVSGFNLIGSSFPVEITLNDPNCPLTKANGFQAGARKTSADVIQIWDTTSTDYSVYFYKSFPDNSCAWVSQNATDTPVENVKIPAGCGFWYKRYNTNGTIKETFPLVSK